MGGPYTLGNEGAVADEGLELSPVSPVDVVGDSGTPLEDSVIREREKVKSSDWARFCSERGLEICSFSFASSRESDPRLKASSECLARLGTPEPCQPNLSWILQLTMTGLTMGGIGVQYSIAGSGMKVASGSTCSSKL